MPYITAEAKDEVRETGPRNAGELNYAITQQVLRYIDPNKGLSYRLLNEVVGVLECVKQELYRRMVAPYEDAKIAENGDVYPDATKVK